MNWICVVHRASRLSMLHRGQIVMEGLLPWLWPCSWRGFKRHVAVCKAFFDSGDRGVGWGVASTEWGFLSLWPYV